MESKKQKSKTKKQKTKENGAVQFGLTCKIPEPINIKTSSLQFVWFLVARQ